MKELIAFPVAYDWDDEGIYDKDLNWICHISREDTGDNPPEGTNSAIGEYMADAINAYHENRWRDVKDEMPLMEEEYLWQSKGGDLHLLCYEPHNATVVGWFRKHYVAWRKLTLYTPEEDQQ